MRSRLGRARQGRRGRAPHGARELRDAVLPLEGLVRAVHNHRQRAVLQDARPPHWRGRRRAHCPTSSAGAAGRGGRHRNEHGERKKAPGAGAAALGRHARRGDRSARLAHHAQAARTGPRTLQLLLRRRSAAGGEAARGPPLRQPQAAVCGQRGSLRGRSPRLGRAAAARGRRLLQQREDQVGQHGRRGRRGDGCGSAAGRGPGCRARVQHAGRASAAGRQRMRQAGGQAREAR